MSQDTQDTSVLERVVVGVDTSDNAARAALWAAREAEVRGLGLHVVHALNLPAVSAMPLEPPEYAAKQHERAAALLAAVIEKVRDQHPEIAVTGEVSELSAPQTIVTLSQSARLVAVGARGHGGFAGLLLGSVSLKLAAHSHCPVVVVRGEESGDPLNEVVLGVGPGEQEAPIRFAFDAAVSYGAGVRVARVWHTGNAHTQSAVASEVADRHHDEADDVAGLLKGIREEYPGVQVAVDILRGNTVPALINESSGSRLLVVGARRARGPLSVGAGYVVRGLLAHSPTPVAVVPIH
jgi:nucleotide-binding universal stress UspA family protein